MNARVLSILSLVVLVLISAVGCAGENKLEQQVNMQQQQIQALAAEVARLDSQQQSGSYLDSGSIAMASSGSGSYLDGASSGASSLDPMYTTPAGFQTPAKDIQRALKVAGYYNGAIDGKIGPDSRKAVREFQTANGLKSDGVVGRQTWSKLKVYLQG